MGVAMEIMIGILLVCAAGSLAFVTRADWGSHIGHGLCKEHLKDLGIGDEPVEYYEKVREGKKRE